MDVLTSSNFRLNLVGKINIHLYLQSNQSKPKQKRQNKQKKTNMKDRQNKTKDKLQVRYYTHCSFSSAGLF